MKILKSLCLMMALLLLLPLGSFARAESTPIPKESADAETPAPEGDADAEAPVDEAGTVPAPAAAGGSIPAPDADNPDLSASAADAAIMLREGMGGARYQHWETALGHAYSHYPLKKATVAMLQCATGDLRDAPVGRDPVTLHVCREVPLPVDDQQLEKGWCYNLHGAIFSSTPLKSATATLTPKFDKGKEQSVTVTFDPAAGIMAWSIDESLPTVEQSSLNDGLNFKLCAAGNWTLTIGASTVGHPETVQLYSSTFHIAAVKEHKLTQNLFDDNWDEIYGFFRGDTDAFLFTYWPSNKASSEFISTDQDWVDKYIVKSELHGARVHAAALENFNQANQYLQTSYIRVVSAKYPYAKVVQLDKLISGGNVGTRVPRFQKNWEYISHHSFGTAADINSKTYPNTNAETNHALIGDDVRDHLHYDGIEVDEKGQQYYAFTYDGTYKGYTNRIPNTIINYLLYELAFYRAGFSWGYYYETTCDAMHFMLTELDINKHLDSERGLRKVWEYYN